MQHLARSLTAARPAFDTVDLAPMAESDAAAVQAALRGCGWITRRYLCHGNWYLPCEGLGFEAYMAQRPSQLLNTWRRKAKAFKRAGGEARLQLVTAPAEVEAGMDAYETIYAKSWKQAEPYPRFVRDWAVICAARGWLRLGIAWVGDAPIAAQFWFTRNRRAYIFKLAYDEAQSKWSAGTVLSAMLFEHSLEVDRAVEIDYLTGDDAYKRSWMNDRRERVGVIACNPRTLRGLLRGGYESAGALRERWRARAAPTADGPDARSVSPISSSE
jgi:Acetyltransferase (GNAT) domain